MTYDAYIAGRVWQVLRQLALARDGHRCRLCDARDDLEVHHRRYPSGNRWHLDRLDALTTLCVPCHDQTTSALRARRYATKAPPPDADVVRLTPIVDRGGSREHRLSEAALQDHRRVTPADAQWPAR